MPEEYQVQCTCGYMVIFGPEKPQVTCKACGEVYVWDSSFSGAGGTEENG
jgi:ribosomal protein S27E